MGWYTGSIRWRGWLGMVRRSDGQTAGWYDGGIGRDGRIGRGGRIGRDGRIGREHAGSIVRYSKGRVQRHR